MIPAHKLTHELLNEAFERSLVPQPEPELPTGLKDLDHLLWGLHRGQVVLIGGFPKSGKTSLALNLAYNSCLACRANAVWYFSFEMSCYRLAQRLLSLITEIPAEDILRHNLTDTQQAIIRAKLPELAGIPLHLRFGEVDTVVGLKNFLLKTNEKDIIIVDYVQKVKTMGEKKNEGIETWINTFCEEAVNKNFAGVVCSQMTQMTGLGEHKKIAGEALKGSRVLEEAPDTILKLDWNESKGEYHIIVDYNRDGGVGKVAIDFFPRTYKFKDL